MKQYILVIFIAFWFFLATPAIQCRAEEVLKNKKHLEKPYNIILIQTDDQRWDTLWAMPELQNTLVKDGVIFTNSFVSTPLCAPSRCSLLSGGFYAHNTGVVGNNVQNGPLRNFNDSRTLAVDLQNSGYKTALVGKYINEYWRLAPYIPPGWDQFTVYLNPKKSKAAWHHFKVVEGSSSQKASTGRIVGINKYKTDYIKEQSIEFIEKNQNNPFFLITAFKAPHLPVEPKKEDQNLFLDYTYRGRSFMEKDLSDKPLYANSPVLNFEDPDEWSKYFNNIARKQLQALQPVDRAVKDIIEKLKELKLLDRTVIMYTSDHGQIWGEHCLQSKNYPYEETIRVPCIIQMPGIKPKQEKNMVVSNLDIPATIYDIAGIERKNDGKSLLPLLRGDDCQWRDNFLIENHKLGSNNVWSGIRTDNYKYIEYNDGLVEFYDLKTDPFEMESMHNNQEYAEIRKSLKLILEKKRKLDITNSPYDLPLGYIGEKFEFQFTTWGAIPPNSWKYSGNRRLPKGLRLDTKQGIIRGIPYEPVDMKTVVMVEDSSFQSQVNRRRTASRRMLFSVSPFHFSPILQLPDHPDSPDLAVMKYLSKKSTYAISFIDSEKGKVVSKYNLGKNFFPKGWNLEPQQGQTRNAELVLLGLNKTDNVSELHIINFEENNRINKITVGTDENPLGLEIIKLNGKTRYLSVLSNTRDSDKIYLKTIDSKNNKVVNQFAIKSGKGKFVESISLNDIDGNNIDDIAILMQGGKQNYFLTVIDPLTGKHISNMELENIKHIVSMVEAPDNSVDHKNEIVLLGMDSINDHTKLVFLNIASKEVVKEQLIGFASFPRGFNERLEPRSLLLALDKENKLQYIIGAQTRVNRIPFTLIKQLTKPGTLSITNILKNSIIYYNSVVLHGEKLNPKPSAFIRAGEKDKVIILNLITNKVDKIIEL